MEVITTSLHWSRTLFTSASMEVYATSFHWSLTQFTTAWKQIYILCSHCPLIQFTKSSFELHSGKSLYHCIDVSKHGKSQWMNTGDETIQCRTTHFIENNLCSIALFFLVLLLYDYRSSCQSWNIILDINVDVDTDIEIRSRQIFDDDETTTMKMIRQWLFFATITSSSTSKSTSTSTHLHLQHLCYD